ncbi:MAG: signal peptide peptidase SppA, partial [Gaiellaceae bacterium]
MKRVWIVVGLLLVLVAGLSALVGVLLRERLGGGVEVTGPAVVEIDLEGPLVEKFAADPFIAGVEPARYQLLDLVRAIRAAARDERVRGVVLRVGAPGYGWAKAEEIREQLAAFRRTGKFVYAYLPPTDELGYYVALAADRIYLLPDGGLELNGFRAETPFVLQTFRKLGLEAQVESVGAYKSAADILRRENMSDEDREVTEGILRERYDRFVDAVVEGRHVDRSAFRAALDRGVYLAADLRALGLVDGELYESQVRELAVRRALDPAEPPEHAEGRVAGTSDASPDTAAEDEHDTGAAYDDHVVHFLDYLTVLPDARRGGGTVALVYAVGAITSGYDGMDPVFGRTLGSASTAEMLREVAADERVNAVVLRVDSPGGDAWASEEIWAEVEELREVVPVVASMSDVAGSGGYYIAAGADEIVAAPSTVTGSIGVLGVVFNAAETWRKLGVTWDTVATNEGAAFPTTTRALTEAERVTFRALIEDLYRGFVERVAAGRGMTVERVDAVAQGRVWSGTQALERGLEDRVGGLQAAIDAAKKLAELDPDAPVSLVVYPR